MLSAVRDRRSFQRKIVVLSCALVAWLAAATTASAVPVLSLVPSSQVVAPGETFSVDFRIDETEETDEISLGWIQFGLAFSSDTLSLLDIAVGSLVSSAGGTLLYADPVNPVNDQVGLVSLLIAGMDQGLLATGSGVLLTATFTALAEGTGNFAALFDDFRFDGLWTVAFEGDPLSFTGACDSFCDTLDALRTGEDPQLRYSQAVSGSLAIESPTSVPEPSTLLLLSTGLAASVVASRRRKRRGSSLRD